MELINFSWLVYIVIAQTFGTYRTCECVTSGWGGQGGYLDFNHQDTTSSRWVKYYWTTGTTIASLTMAVSMFYITVEWMQQSWLHTEDYDDAMAGLRQMRTYKNKTYWFRILSRFLLSLTVNPLHRVLLFVGLFRKTQKSLLWTKEVTWNESAYAQPSSSSSRSSGHHHRFPSIELTDYSNQVPPAHANVTPRLPEIPHFDGHLLPTFQPMIRTSSSSDASVNAPSAPPSRPHSASDASLLSHRPPDQTGRPRSSTDASRHIGFPPVRYYPMHHRLHRDSDASIGTPPLIRVPVATHPAQHWTSSAPPVFDEDDAHAHPSNPPSPSTLEPASPPTQREGGYLRGVRGLTVRQGFRRLSSDAATPLDERRGLGLDWETTDERYEEDVERRVRDV